MEKRLKEFIRKNRNEFDDQQVPEGMWSQINRVLDKDRKESGVWPAERLKVKKRSNQRFFFNVAAAVAMLIIAGAGAYFYGKKQGYEDYARINPELAAAQHDYIKLVNLKKDSVAFYSISNPDLESEFVQVLHQMETNYEFLKKELPDSPNKERILEAMIINLQAQAAVLNQQMNILSNLKGNPYETL